MWDFIKWYIEISKMYRIRLIIAIIVMFMWFGYIIYVFINNKSYNDIEIILPSFLDSMVQTKGFKLITHLCLGYFGLNPRVEILCGLLLITSTTLILCVILASYLSILFIPLTLICVSGAGYIFKNYDLITPEITLEKWGFSFVKKQQYMSDNEIEEVVNNMFTIFCTLLHKENTFVPYDQFNPKIILDLLKDQKFKSPEDVMNQINLIIPQLNLLVNNNDSINLNSDVYSSIISWLSIHWVNILTVIIIVIVSILFLHVVSSNLSQLINYLTGGTEDLNTAVEDINTVTNAQLDFSQTIEDQIKIYMEKTEVLHSLNENQKHLITNYLHIQLKEQFKTDAYVKVLAACSVNNNTIHKQISDLLGDLNLQNTNITEEILQLKSNQVNISTTLDNNFSNFQEECIKSIKLIESNSVSKEVFDAFITHYTEQFDCLVAVVNAIKAKIDKD